MPLVQLCHLIILKGSCILQQIESQLSQAGVSTQIPLGWVSVIIAI
jgi:hypothetical protein